MNSNNNNGSGVVSTRVDSELQYLSAILADCVERLAKLQQAVTPTTVPTDPKETEDRPAFDLEMFRVTAETEYRRLLLGYTRVRSVDSNLLEEFTTEMWVNLFQQNPSVLHKFPAHAASILERLPLVDRFAIVTAAPQLFSRFRWYGTPLEQWRDLVASIKTDEQVDMLARLVCAARTQYMELSPAPAEACRQKAVLAEVR